MLLLRKGFLLFVGGILFVGAVGCPASQEATVAPRTEEEIAEYKADVYAEEEADSAAAEDDE